MAPRMSSMPTPPLMGAAGGAALGGVPAGGATSVTATLGGAASVTATLGGAASVTATLGGAALGGDTTGKAAPGTGNAGAPAAIQALMVAISSALRRRLPSGGMAESSVAVIRWY